MTTSTFLEYYTSNRLKLRGYIFKHTKSFPDTSIDDLVQETFLRAFTNKDSIQDENYFGTWLCKIANSIIVDRWRKKKHEKEAIEMFYSYLPKTNLSYLSNLNTIIKTIKMDTDNIVQSYLLEDKDYNSLANKFNVRPGTVASKIFYGKKLLMEKLEKEGIYYGTRKRDEKESMGQTNSKYLDAN